MSDIITLKPTNISASYHQYGILSDIFNGSFWGIDYNSALIRWVKFETNASLKRLSFKATSDRGYTIPYKIEIHGSNDYEFNNSDLLIEKSGLTNSNVIDIDSSKKYKYHMLKIYMLNGQASELSDFKAEGILLAFNGILKNPTTNQYYSLTEKTLISLTDSSNENIINYGIEAGKEIKLDEAFNKVKFVRKTTPLVMLEIPIPVKKKIRTIKVESIYE